jgi:hypothetical protein
MAVRAVLVPRPEGAPALGLYVESVPAGPLATLAGAARYAVESGWERRDSGGGRASPPAAVNAFAPVLAGLRRNCGGGGWTSRARFAVLHQVLVENCGGELEAWARGGDRELSFGRPGPSTHPAKGVPHSSAANAEDAATALGFAAALVAARVGASLERRRVQPRPNPVGAIGAAPGRCRVFIHEVGAVALRGLATPGEVVRGDGALAEGVRRGLHVALRALAPGGALVFRLPGWYDRDVLALLALASAHFAGAELRESPQPFDDPYFVARGFAPSAAARATAALLAAPVVDVVPYAPRYWPAWTAELEPLMRRQVALEDALLAAPVVDVVPYAPRYWPAWTAELEPLMRRQVALEDALLVHDDPPRVAPEAWFGRWWSVEGRMWDPAAPGALPRIEGLSPARRQELRGLARRRADGVGRGAAAPGAAAPAKRKPDAVHAALTRLVEAGAPRDPPLEGVAALAARRVLACVVFRQAAAAAAGPPRKDAALQGYLEGATVMFASARAQAPNAWKGFSKVLAVSKGCGPAARKALARARGDPLDVHVVEIAPAYGVGPENSRWINPRILKKRPDYAEIAPWALRMFDPAVYARAGLPDVREVALADADGVFLSDALAPGSRAGTLTSVFELAARLPPADAEPLCAVGAYAAHKEWGGDPEELPPFRRGRRGRGRRRGGGTRAATVERWERRFGGRAGEGCWIPRVWTTFAGRVERVDADGPFVRAAPAYHMVSTEFYAFRPSRAALDALVARARGWDPAEEAPLYADSELLTDSLRWLALSPRWIGYRGAPALDRLHAVFYCGTKPWAEGTARWPDTAPWRRARDTLLN